MRQVEGEAAKGKEVKAVKRLEGEAAKSKEVGEQRRIVKSDLKERQRDGGVE